MTNNIKTLELARLYEQQGYNKDALDIYMYLNEQSSNTELQEAVERLKQKAGNSSDQEWERITELCEEWVRLMLIKMRLNICPILNCQLTK